MLIQIHSTCLKNMMRLSTALMKSGAASYHQKPWDSVTPQFIVTHRTAGSMMPQLADDHFWRFWTLYYHVGYLASHQYLQKASLGLLAPFARSARKPIFASISGYTYPITTIKIDAWSQIDAWMCVHFKQKIPWRNDIEIFHPSSEQSFLSIVIFLSKSGGFTKMNG